jgi:hypothetical protein
VLHGIEHPVSHPYRAQSVFNASVRCTAENEVCEPQLMEVGQALKGRVVNYFYLFRIEPYETMDRQKHLLAVRLARKG